MLPVVGGAAGRFATRSCRCRLAGSVVHQFPGAFPDRESSAALTRTTDKRRGTQAVAAVPSTVALAVQPGVDVAHARRPVPFSTGCRHYSAASSSSSPLATSPLPSATPASSSRSPPPSKEGGVGIDAPSGIRAASSSVAPSQPVIVEGKSMMKWKRGPKNIARLFRRTVGRVLDVSRRTGRNAAKLAVAFVKNPRVIADWTEDLYNATVHFMRWVVTGFKLFRRNLGASFFLVKRVAQGYQLTVRQRRLLVRTTADCLKLIPFSFFIIVPFAELALPLALRLFPNLMPSTFFETKYDKPTLARKLKAKQEVAQFWQQVVAERTREILDDEGTTKWDDRATELQIFQEKLQSGYDFPSMKEILRFSRLFEEEFKLVNFSAEQLRSMSSMLGLRPMDNDTFLKLQLRHHITNLRSEDRDYLWEGVESLKKEELIEACKKRAIRFHGVTETDMQSDLMRWLELSSNRQIPTSLLLWIQSFYLSSNETIEGDAVEGHPKPDSFRVHTKLEGKPDVEPEEAFFELAERSKAQADSAVHKLEDLRHEIDEACEEDRTETLRGSVHVSLAAEDPQQDPRKYFEVLALQREIIERQRLQLYQQLKFMSNMRDNMPSGSKDQDSGKILLDQRVRLVEMVNSFEQDTTDIEQLLNKAVTETDLAFDRIDVNKDGVISREEFHLAFGVKERTMAQPSR